MPHDVTPELPSALLLPRTGLGYDSHRFVTEAEPKPLILAGLTIPEAPGLAGHSDADVIFHALCNAVSGISGSNILGPPADALCRDGITDSRVYLERALATLAKHPGRPRLVHASLTVEAARPRLWDHLPALRDAVAKALGLPPHAVGLTATSGEGLTAVGSGEGMACWAVVTAVDTVPAASRDI